VAEQRVKLTAAQVRTVVALAKEQGELERQLAEVQAAFDELGELYRQKHQLPPGKPAFWAEESGDIYLVVDVPEPEKKAEPERPELTDLEERLREAIEESQTQGLTLAVGEEPAET
jgi:hypothetical protein